VEKKILLVGNSLPLYTSVDFILSGCGYGVVSVKDAKSAVRKCREGRYDLLIVNFKNIGAPMRELQIFLQNRDPHIPVLALIAPEWNRENENENLYGITDWLVIPFSNEKLINCVRRLCG